MAHAERAVAGLAAEAAISGTLAAFTRSLKFEDIPAAVIERAKLHILDGLGIALAAGRYDYSAKTLKAMQDLAGEGPYPVIGMGVRLPLRDAALMNGFLIHALDYDDTHVPGVLHATASAVPTVLAMGQKHGIDGREALVAYLAAIEADARIGAAAKGGFHRNGFHPTGVVGAYGAALAAGRIAGLGEAELQNAQGVVMSMASGTLGFLDEGSWNKRLHPGWASAAGITAAALAAGGFEGPSKPYEGRFGLYHAYIGNDADIDLSACTRGLGETWEMLAIGIKPYPACHLVHAVADATAELVREHGLQADQVATIRARLAEDCLKVVGEPLADKQRPRTGYDAQFSAPYAIASILTKGQLTLAELEPEVFTDPAVLAECDKVTCEIDPDSAFPKYYSGEVVITTTDGRELSHREQVNRGADQRPLSADEIIAKYQDNARLRLDRSEADKALDTIMRLDGGATPTEVAKLLGKA